VLKNHPLPKYGTGGLDNQANVDVLLNSLLDSALQIAGVKRGSILILDEKEKVLKIRGSRGLSDSVVKDTKLPIGKGLAGKVAETGKLMHLTGPKKGKQGIEESLILPLKIMDSVLGTMNISREAGPPWTADLKECVINFADSMSQVLEVVQNSNDRDRRMAEMDRILAFSRIFGSTRELSKILEMLLSTARELTECRASFVTMINPVSGFYQSWASQNMQGDVLDDVIDVLRKCSSHEFFSSATPEEHCQLEKLPENHPLFTLWQTGQAERAIVVPLVFGYRILGRLYLMDHKISNVQKSTLRLLILLTREAAIAIDQAHAMQELREMAFIDPLTRVYNRNFWIQRFEEELIRSNRRTQPLSLLMLDIDYFKVYNDTYGHLVGDEVLRTVAQVIRSCLREVDVIGRYGGEEFGVLLPDTDEHGANYVAERVRHKVENLELGNKGAGAGKLTISIGISTCQKEALTMQKLISQADTALFVSKERGRNQVNVFSSQGIFPGTSKVVLDSPKDIENERLSSSSEFLYKMADSLKVYQKERPEPIHLDFMINILGSGGEEFLTLAGLFEAMGYRPNIMYQQEEFDQACELKMPDMVILDLSADDRPQGDFHLLEKLKEKDPLLPVIVIVDAGNIQEAVKAIRIGADDYVLKPFGAAEIRKSVEKAFSKRLKILMGSAATDRPISEDDSIGAELSLASSEINREYILSARELRIMQEFNKRSIESPNHGALMIDSAFKVVQVNRLATEMLGLDEGLSLGEILFKAAPALDNSRISNALTHVEHTGESLVINDIWLQTNKTGSSSMHKIVVQPAMLDTGEFYLFILIESIVNKRMVAEESRKLRIRIAQRIYGRVAQHLQVISGRGELWKNGAPLDDHSLTQLVTSAREIGIILSELGSDVMGVDESD
jgi:diguanylate cyclase (GGDEF)-like protein